MMIIYVKGGVSNFVYGENIKIAIYSLVVIQHIHKWHVEKHMRFFFLFEFAYPVISFFFFFSQHN